MHQKISSTSLSERYATALFSLASEQETNTLSLVKHDLEVLSKIISGSTDIKIILNNPLICVKEQDQILRYVLEKIDASQLTRSFLSILCHNGRLPIFFRIIESFFSLIIKSREKAIVHVISANTLSIEQKRIIQLNIERIIEKKAQLNIDIDPRILGGFIIKMNSYIFDASLMTKINNLTLGMKGEIKK